MFLGITSGYHGGLAEYIALSEEVLTNGIIHKMPEQLSFDRAALAEPCSSVLAANDRAGTSIRDVVVVMGAGPIGCIHTAVAHSRGARVVISEPSDARRKLAEAFEPEAMVDPMNEDLESVVRSMTDGRGADVVVCANPIAATQTQAVEIVRKRGKVVLFGGLPNSNPTTTFDGNKIHYEEIEVIGSFSYHPSYHALALKALERGIIPAEAIITAKYELDEVVTAFENAASGQELKVIVNP
jgi:L-iditol 2-dehydrogenase